MSKIAIVTDSTAYIPPHLLDQYQIIVAPLILIWGDETFQDGVDIEPNAFYQRLQGAKVMPSSSQVTPSTFEKIYRSLLDQDMEILTILISSKLSGTIDSAVQAVASLPAGSPIQIVDSYSTTMGMGFQVLKAARAIEAGATLMECKKLVESCRERTGVIFTVDTLEFLHRGGRIGGGTRFLGSALNIKPILELENGKLEAVERVRTRQKALARLLDLVAVRTNGAKALRMSCLNAMAPEEAQDTIERAAHRFNLVEKYITDLSPVIGTHVGPGTLGLAYMIEN